MANKGSNILKERALYLWDLHGERYRTLIEEYDALLKEIKERKLRQDRIGNETRRDYPKIEFLDISDRKFAKRYLDEKSEVELSVIIHSIEVMINENYSYRTFITRVSDYRQRLKASKISKKELSLAPIGDSALPSKYANCQRTMSGATDDFFTK